MKDVTFKFLKTRNKEAKWNNYLFQWSCIHNIEERMSSDESDCNEDDEEDDISSDDCKKVRWPGSSTSISTTPSYIIQHTVVQQVCTKNFSLSFLKGGLI